MEVFKWLAVLDLNAGQLKLVGNQRLLSVYCQTLLRSEPLKDYFRAERWKQISFSN